MRGREKYARVGVLLRVGQWGVRLLPKLLRNAIATATSSSDSLMARAYREALLKCEVQSCGDLVDIRQYVVLRNMKSVAIGSRVSVHPFCYIDGLGGLKIGSDVSIAHSSSIITTEHNYKRLDVPIRDQGTYSASVEIHDDVWIGAGVRILAGTTIGTHSVVAAGAVVVNDVPPYSVVAGVPARVVSQIKD